MLKQMKTTAAVAASLKRVLKKKRVSYRDLARRLHLSESGVKKMMTAPDLSLGRLAAICGALQVDLVDLLESALRSPPARISFTAAQEKYLADHRDDAAYLTALIDAAFDTAEVERRFGLDRRSTRIYLKRLEKQRFIERTEAGARSLLGSLEYLQSALASHLTVPSLERAMAAPRTDRCLRTGRVRLTAGSLEKLNQEILDLLLRYSIVARRDELQTRDQDLLDVWVIAGSARQQLSEVLAVPRQTR
jgi:DNA-binding Xre family transcriptional regulator